jgi:hypothetical protein
MKKLVALMTLLAVLTGCGGDGGGGGGDRPSADDIAKALKDTGNPNGAAIASQASDDAIDCVAKVLHDSDLSDEALKALVDGDSSFKGNTDDEKAIAGLSDDFAKCITG